MKKSEAYKIWILCGNNARNIRPPPCPSLGSWLDIPDNSQSTHIYPQVPFTASRPLRAFDIFQPPAELRRLPHRLRGVTPRAQVRLMHLCIVCGWLLRRWTCTAGSSAIAACSHAREHAHTATIELASSEYACPELPQLRWPSGYKDNLTALTGCIKRWMQFKSSQYFLCISELIKMYAPY